MVAVALAFLVAGAGMGQGKAPEESMKALKDAIMSSSAKDGVKAFAVEKLLPLCVNAVFVAEVEKQNILKVSLDEIKKIDKQWMEAEDELPIQKEKMTNACAQELKRIAKEFPAIAEAFVMDNQGANVGMSRLTSDYWQGDEPKWQNSYKGGKGGVDVGKESFDKSAGATIQQISLPILNAKGEAIGAVTFGLIVAKTN